MFCKFYFYRHKRKPCVILRRIVNQALCNPLYNMYMYIHKVISVVRVEFKHSTVNDGLPVLQLITLTPHTMPDSPDLTSDGAKSVIGPKYTG